MFKSKKLIYYMGGLSLLLLLFVEPYIRNYESEQVSFLSSILAVWIILSVPILFINAGKVIKDIGFIVGVATVFLLIGRAFYIGNFIFELLPISYSLIFICSAVISRNIALKKIEYERIMMYFVFASCAGMIYANSLAFGIVGDFVATDQRYSLVLDSNAAVLTVVVAVAIFLYYSDRKIKIMAALVVLLALIRLVSFGSKGPFITSIFIIFFQITICQYKGYRVQGLLLFSGILILGYLFASAFTSIGNYVNILTGRFDDSDTWLARLSEAVNDLNAFSENPLLGWGRVVPGLNILGETSSGHITITGMLARLGLVGTLGLGVFYVSYFKKLLKYIFIINKNVILMQIIFIGFLIFVIYLLVLGNPLFLFPCLGVSSVVVSYRSISKIG